MATTYEFAQLPALAAGYSLLGSGGGGATTMLELLLADPSAWPTTVFDIDELDPALPCLAAAFVGSTMLLQERLPGAEPFARLIGAVERWLGAPVPVVCSLEGGGLNGLAPFTLAADRVLVDADLTGRAVPSLDQMSMLVDRVPGIFVACDTGAEGVALVDTPRAIDIERVVRAATIQAGGSGGMVFAGMTVGQLREHSIVGNTARALKLGTAYLANAAGPLDELASAVGGRLLGVGRITTVDADVRDPHVSTFGIEGACGEVHRLVTRSESLAFMTDGLLEAAAPDLVVVIDVVTRDILEVSDLSMGRHVAILEIPGPEWWGRSPERLRHVVPSAYGLDELDAAV